MKPDYQECRRCGSCCRAHAGNISATLTDIRRWMREGRKDILIFFFIRKEDGSLIRGDVEGYQTMEGVTGIEMRNPVNLERFCVCPFLRQETEDRSACSIHETKPRVCFYYTPWKWAADSEITSCPTREKPV
ncbi:YkgJ family cysteine cluster protein [uncultured Methanoregula sp.]|uniref:YkgJ family cysteine cluster protein n=1 Tax=uncultured Methanoregula sp. TaxID=1005933 RepID=UPI002AAAF95B|nr:YkgJ family cysteine cluster protein [uncultured Methanoregula sp.]